MAIDTIIFTGEKSSFFAVASATGAIIRTVATLSMKADISALKSERNMTVHFMLGALLVMISASREGIPESMNRETVPMVPAIIMITFQSMAPGTFDTGSIPRTT